jgi:nucleoside-diphosphate-sugar epimerase
MNIDGNTILITGSTGFIGTHLVSHFTQLKGVHIRGLVKNRSIPATRLDELRVEKVFGDMTSVEDMRTATKGCDIVIHCAVGLPRENPIGTKAAIKAALENGVKKFIHLSSTAVFGYWPSANEIKDGRLDYNYSTNNYLNEYCYSKIESEKIAFSYYDSAKLPLVVLRLSNVFGPNSTFWTLNAIKMLEKGCYTIINGGFTPSNSIYVDNVVDAITIAIKEDKAVGQALIISDEQAISWRHFFSSYAQMLSRNNSISETTSYKLKCQRKKEYLKLLIWQTSNKLKNKASLEWLPSTKLGINSLIPRIGNVTINNKFLAVTQNQSGTKNTATENKAQEVLSKIPQKWLEKSFTLPYQFPIKKAKDVLGFKPKTTFDQGMKYTAQWLDCYQKTLVAPT